MKRHQKSNFAFTLIELQVVIAIIAVLAAILFPVFARAKAAAGDAKTISNIRQLGVATLLYLDDADDVYPSATDGTPGTNRLGGWIAYNQFGNTKAGGFLVEWGSLFPYVKGAGIYQSSGDHDFPTSHNSFALNGTLGTWQPGGLNPGKSAATVEFPSSTMLFGEEGSGQDSAFFYGYANGTNDGYFNPNFDHFGHFHPAGTAIAYCDTHAKIVPAQDRYILTVCGSEKLCW